MLLTDKGEFSGFNTLRHAYLDAFHGNPPITRYFNVDPWREDTLHISELGKCPRKQMYRLLGAEKKQRSEEALANDALMFYQGNVIHALSVGACDWAGILVSFEEALPDLPEGWSGHYDLIYDDRIDKMTPIRDFKTVRQNAFNYWYNWPKKEEKAQLRGYLRFLPECFCAEVEHIDRGGANPPQVHAIVRDDKWVDDRMQELEEWQEALIESILPPVLPWEYSISYLKVRNEPLHKLNTIYYGPQWECGWCDYLHGLEDKKTKEWYIFEGSPCKPRMEPKQQVAKVVKGELKYDLKEHQESVKLWLRDQLLTWTEASEDVD